MEASILRGKKRGGGVTTSCPPPTPPFPLPPPPLAEEEKKSAEFQAGGGGGGVKGGWAPFMPNITILIALMLFLVWRSRGRGGSDRKLSQHGTPMFLITTLLFLSF